MTNKEKCEIIKQFVDKKDVVGILGSFLIDDAYKDVEFVKYIKENDREMFNAIHPIIVAELERYQNALMSSVFIMEKTNVPDRLKSELSFHCRQLVEKSLAIGSAAKELGDTFDKANR